MAIRWYMSDFEIGREYRLAKDPAMMVEVLAGLNAVSMRTMRKKLIALGLLPAARKGEAPHSHWTREEDAILERAMEEGCSFAATAARLCGRSVKSVRNRWYRMQTAVRGAQAV